jgi:hypothetical protein
MSDLNPMYRIENILARNISKKTVIKHATVWLPHQTNPPAGMNQRTDRETSVALSQRLCAYCQSGSDHFTSPSAIPDRSNSV